MTSFVTRYHNETIVRTIDDELKSEVMEKFQDVPVKAEADLMELLIRIAEAKGQQFIFIIDEWDAICRELNSNPKVMDLYVNWLRGLFKDANANKVFAGVYMTGILPIKKYRTESALNNFIEYSMVAPASMESYFGFTKDEVRSLAGNHSMDYEDLGKWYDGYLNGGEQAMFNPNSVMQAITRRWNLIGCLS